MKRWGLRCRMCGRSVKELCSCDVTFEAKIVQVNFCLKCMKRLGLKDKNIENGLFRSHTFPRV